MEVNLYHQLNIELIFKINVLVLKPIHVILQIL